MVSGHFARMRLIRGLEHRVPDQKQTKDDVATGSDATSETVIDGVVKWFDTVKGYGFIVADGMDSDILLHANALRNYGLGSVCDGARMRITVQKTPRGLQTSAVLDIQPPEGEEEVTVTARLAEAVQIDTSIPLEPARVKWFDKGKGFGFANVFSRSEDVFVHVATLRRAGLADLHPGEAIALRVIDGERGRMAASIEPWEAALPRDPKVTEAQE